MKLNYISVMKEYVLNTKEEKYVIRGVFDCVPPSIWFKHLQLLWICSPRLVELCPEPFLKKNEIIISIYEQENIIEVMDALKSLIKKVGYSYIIQSDKSFFLNFKESTI